MKESIENNFKIELTESDVDTLAKSINRSNNADYFPEQVLIKNENVVDGAIALIHLYKQIHDHAYKMPVMRAFEELATQNNDKEYLAKLINPKKADTEHMKFVLQEHQAELRVMLQMIEKDSWNRKG